MKKIFFGLAALTMAAGMFACNKDKDNTPKPGEQQPTPISGVYFRMKMHDSTVVFHYPADTIALTLEIDSSGGSYARKRTEIETNEDWGIYPFDFKHFPSAPGTFQVSAGMADSKYVFESDTLRCIVTRGAKLVGDTVEGSFSGVLHRYDVITDTVHVSGDFRLHYDRDFTKE